MLTLSLASEALTLTLIMHQNGNNLLLQQVMAVDLSADALILAGRIENFSKFLNLYH